MFKLVGQEMREGFVELTQWTAQQSMDRFITPPIHPFCNDNLIVTGRIVIKVDEDVLIVDLPPLFGQSDSFANSVQRRDALLAVQNILNVVPLRRIRKLVIAEVPVAAQFVLGLPEDEGADGIALQDGVDELRRLLLVPDKFALEHG